MKPVRFALRVVLFLSAGAALFAEQATDRRFHVSFGKLAGSDAIVQTPEGAAVAFTASFSLPAASFVPDPYAEKCRFLGFKYTLKPADQKEILGDQYKAPDPDADDPLVLHPIELQNAAGKFHANSIYLLLSDSEDLKDVKGLHDCAIVSKDGDRYRGETLNEVSCQDARGAARKFSQYAGRAAYYACGGPPAKAPARGR